MYRMAARRDVDAHREGGGKALRQAIHVARARAGMTTDTEVALAAGVSYDTLMNWYGDKTTPRPGEVRRVAIALGARFADLMAAYDGTDPEPVPLQDAIRELIEEMREGRRQQEIAALALIRATTAVLEAHGIEPVTSLSAPSTSRRRSHGRPG